MNTTPTPVPMGIGESDIRMLGDALGPSFAFVIVGLLVIALLLVTLAAVWAMGDRQ